MSGHNNPSTYYDLWLKLRTRLIDEATLADYQLDDHSLEKKRRDNQRRYEDLTKLCLLEKAIFHSIYLYFLKKLEEKMKALHELKYSKKELIQRMDDIDALPNYLREVKKLIAQIEREIMELEVYISQRKEKYDQLRNYGLGAWNHLIHSDAATKHYIPVNIAITFPLELVHLFGSSGPPSHLTINREDFIKYAELKGKHIFMGNTISFSNLYGSNEDILPLLVEVLKRDNPYLSESDCITVIKAQQNHENIREGRHELESAMHVMALNDNELMSINSEAEALELEIELKECELNHLKKEKVSLENICDKMQGKLGTDTNENFDVSQQKTSTCNTENSFEINDKNEASSYNDGKYTTIDLLVNQLVDGNKSIIEDVRKKAKDEIDSFYGKTDSNTKDNHDSQDSSNKEIVEDLFMQQLEETAQLSLDELLKACDQTMDPTSDEAPNIKPNMP